MKLLMCMLIALTAGCALAGSEGEETPYLSMNDRFYNPVLSSANDPWIVRGESCYYYCYGSGGGICIARSDTLSCLMSASLKPENMRVIPPLDKQTEIWAPELHCYQGRWYVFYAADYNNDNTLHRMYAVRSVTDNPLGEWEEPVKLELPEDQWAIDGTFFEYKDGRIFFIWSGWKNVTQGTSLWKQYLYIAELKTGDPTVVSGTDRVMIAKPQYYWEMSRLPQNEGPCVLVSPKGTVYCMYAGNYSGSNDYTVAAVRLIGDPMDASAWEKLPDPVLSSNEQEGIYAPGHASFVKSPDGSEDWIIYHTAKASGSGWNRNGRMQMIQWADDTPTVAGGVAGNDVLQPLPAGEKTDRRLIQLEDGVLTGGVKADEGLTDSKHLTFSDLNESATVRINAEKEGSCALYIRHNTPTPETAAAIYITVNGENRYGKTAAISGAPSQFVLDCIIVELHAGINELAFTAQEGVALDLVIADMQPWGNDGGE